MTTQTEKEFYIETKHYVYVDYTIRARDKEHALEQFKKALKKYKGLFVVH